MFRAFAPFVSLALLCPAAFATIGSQTLTWQNVRIGGQFNINIMHSASNLSSPLCIGGGGFVPNIVFNPSQKGLAYARTDIGGAYRLNSDDTWTALTDFANDTTWYALFLFLTRSFKTEILCCLGTIGALTR